jgi:hypothetical protein
LIWDELSVSNMRDWTSGDDFDIFELVSLRDRMRLEGPGI